MLPGSAASVEELTALIHGAGMAAYASSSGTASTASSVAMNSGGSSSSDCLHLPGRAPIHGSALSGAFAVTEVRVFQRSEMVREANVFKRSIR